jgi:hypothetical protein
VWILEVAACRIMNMDATKSRLRAFASERSWEPFHTHKNLAMALAAESGELVDVFRWLTPEEWANDPAEDMGDSRTASISGL